MNRHILNCVREYNDTMKAIKMNTPEDIENLSEEQLEQQQKAVTMIRENHGTVISGYIDKLIVGGDGQIKQVDGTKELWDILYRYGLYKPSLRNWQDQVN